jgi:hypothetical protein
MELSLWYQSKLNLDLCPNKSSFHPQSQYLEIQFVATFPVSRGGFTIRQHVFDEVLSQHVWHPFEKAAFQLE